MADITPTILTGLLVAALLLPVLYIGVSALGALETHESFKKGNFHVGREG